MTLDATAIDLAGLWKSLEPHAKGVPGNVILEVRCPRPLSRARNRCPASYVFAIYLESCGRRVGFQDVDVRVRPAPRDWKYANDWESLVADVREALPEPGRQVEKGVGDEQVKLYAIQTGLSRFLYGEDVDCVIHIIPTIEEVEPDVVQRMARYLPQLNLKRRRRVAFLYHWTKPETEHEFSVQYCGERVWREVLGFETYRWTGWN